jgi:hypothetical protein
MKTFTFIITVILATGCPTYLVTAQSNISLTPVAEDGLRQWVGSKPFVLGWGYGDVFNQSDAIDQTVIDFKLNGFEQGTRISSATLTFFLQAQHSGSFAAPIDIATFYGESTIQAGDWNGGSYFASFADPYGIQNWDITSAVQSAINAGTDFLDLRMSTTDPQCVANIDPSWQSPRLSLDIMLVPEPSALEMLVFSIGLTFTIRNRVSKKFERFRSPNKIE